MNLTKIITSIFLVITSAFIIMSLMTNDPIKGQLFACIGIIIGALGSQYISNKNAPVDEN